ncbi:GNAT family N-acetyltransferase [Streptomyces marokkonensis]
MTSPLKAAPQWTLTAVPCGSPDARTLARALHQEQLATYGTADDPGATQNAEFDAPNGPFLVARLGDGPALACGGWRTLNTSAAEIKRIYVAPPARGRGLGRRILVALEQDVLGRGPTEVLLETGIRGDLSRSPPVRDHRPPRSRNRERSSPANAG